jgi:rhodanese-related sulfurtransferase
MTYQPEGKASYREITAKEGKAMLDDRQVLLLDVRTPREHYTAHVPGSRLIPLHQLQQRLTEIEDYKDKPVLVYCRSGNRSTVAAEILVKHGFKKIVALRHGILEWEKEGYKILKGSSGEIF